MAATIDPGVRSIVVREDGIVGTLIPVEYFGRATKWLANREEIRLGTLGIAGGSRGGELALLIASTFPEIRAVVGWAPEGINGPVLLISGSDDQVWPGSLLAEIAVRRLRERLHQFAVEQFCYEGAGHGIMPARAYPSSGATHFLHPVTGYDRLLAPDRSGRRSPSRKYDGSDGVVEYTGEVIGVAEGAGERSDQTGVVLNREYDRRLPHCSVHLDDTGAARFDRVGAAAVPGCINGDDETGARKREVFCPGACHCLRWGR